MRAYHLLAQLSRRHAVTLLSFGLPGRNQDVGPLEALCGVVEVVARTAIDGRRLGRHGLLSSVPRHLVQNESAAMKDLVARHVANHDVAIGLELDAARYLEPWTSIPRVFEDVEVAVLREQYLCESRRLRRARSALTWLKFRHFIRRLVNKYERATVVSEREREHLRTIGCDVARVSVVPNGIEVPCIRSPGRHAERLIYPGSVTYSANLDAVRFFIREVLPLVRRSRPDLEFWVTGSTDGVEISNLMAPGVRFTGCLPEVDSVIAESAACVVPLRIGGGTRLKVLQAMAVSTPVVSTSKGIEGLEVQPERHALMADTPEAFAAQVLRLCSDPLLGQRLTREGQRLVQERYAWPEIGDALERVIEGAVEEHRRRHRQRYASPA
jgi:polysaccharide biosynthesis protein PslH